MKTASNTRIPASKVKCGHCGTLVLQLTSHAYANRARRTLCGLRFREPKTYPTTGIVRMCGLCDDVLRNAEPAAFRTGYVEILREPERTRRK